MTQGISGSGARRWSVRKPCRAAQVQESSARCVLYRGPGASPASLWPLSGRSERDPPAGRAPLWSARVGRVEGRHLIRHGIRRDAFPEGKAFGDTAWAVPLSHKGKLPKQDGSDRLEGAHTVRPFCCFCEIGLTGTYNFVAGAGSGRGRRGGQSFGEENAVGLSEKGGERDGSDDAGCGGDVADRDAGGDLWRHPWCPTS